MNSALSKRLAAEALGTFCLVFAGTTAIVVNADGVITHVGVALTFGLVVSAMIAAVGDISGAHINPAVTIGLYLARRISSRAVAPYILSQCGGAILASTCVWLLFPTGDNLGATVPAGPVHQSWILEVVVTAILMLVILGVSTGARDKGITAGLAIGGTVALAALFAGPVSGASMNPARSLGPALVSGQLGVMWLYFTAPVVGAAVAVALCRCVREEHCCRSVPLETASGGQ